MFYIDQSTPSFQKAKEKHYANVRYIIKKKLLGKKFDEPPPGNQVLRIYQIADVHPSVKRFLVNENNLRNVLIGTPATLDRIKERFSAEAEKKTIRSLFPYSAFIDKDGATFKYYNAYHLAENLGITTCVYCNRLYTHTVITKKREYIARPTFDHWFPKTQYPLLALSFYNLIPSCSICNSSIKGTAVYTLQDHFHPYFRHPSSERILDFKFSYTLKDHERVESRVISKNDFTAGSLEAMKLQQIYSTHADEIRELIYLKKAYSDSYLTSLSSILKSNLTKEEIYRLAFGVYLEDDQLYKRPLSKLKKDILEELGIVS